MDINKDNNDKTNPVPVYRSPSACTPSAKLISAWVLTACVLSLVMYLLVASFTREPHNHAPLNISSDPGSQVVVVMISGLRWDHLDILSSGAYGPGFNLVKENSVRVEFVETVFPSLKLPAWTTIHTGVYPGTHGVLGNVMFDRETKKHFNWDTHENVEDPIWWSAAEPIWITATKQGKRVATIEWLSANIPFDGILPEVAGGFTGSKRSFRSRMNDAIKYLREGFNLIMLSYDGVDRAMKKSGLYSNQMRVELRAVGDGLATLVNFVELHGLEQRVNFVVVSDRGLTSACDMPPAPDLNATLLALRDDVLAVERDQGVYAVYTTRPERGARVAERLKLSPAYETLLRKNVPKELHYRMSRRSPDVLVLAVPLTADRSEPAPLTAPTALTDSQTPSAWPRAYPGSRCPLPGGVCGLDPRRSPAMRTLFLGWGEAFSGRGLVHPPMALVDVYQIIAHLCRVRPLKHDGSWHNVKSMLGGVRPYGTVTESPTNEPTVRAEEFNRYLKERFLFTKRLEMKFAAIRCRSGTNGATTAAAIAAFDAVTMAVAIVLHWWGNAFAATAAVANALSIFLVFVLH